MPARGTARLSARLRAWVVSGSGCWKERSAVAVVMLFSLVWVSCLRYRARLLCVTQQQACASLAQDLTSLKLQRIMILSSAKKHTTKLLIRSRHRGLDETSTVFDSRTPAQRDCLAL